MKPKTLKQIEKEKRDLEIAFYTMLSKIRKQGKK